MVLCCFKQGCKLEADYVCECLFSLTYSCESHLQLHLNLPNRSHSLNSVLAEPSELTKEVILKFLAKEKAKKEKLMDIALTSFNQNSENRENSIQISLNDLISDLDEISCLIKKISQVSEDGPPSSSEEFDGVTLFCLRQLRNKRYKILNKSNNDVETEQDFRRTCSLYGKYASNSLLSQTYEEYLKEYQKFTSIYLISNKVRFHFDRAETYKANLHIYNTETEKEESKVLEINLETKSFSFLTQLPNGELFFVNSKNSLAFILDKNYRTRALPAGLPKDCFGAIYFNRSVYCFGGIALNPSRRFDLDRNCWSSLTIMKRMIYGYFSCVAFNRNILISNAHNAVLLLYSIDINSFSEIPYSFGILSKILINGKERLYLIECKGWIYESEINDEYNWKRIAKSIIEDYPAHVYCSFNKGGIFISTLCNDDVRAYFKFDLNLKKMIDISLYGKKLDLKRSGNTLKVIQSYENTFKLDPNHAAIYVDKGCTLYNIVKNLEDIEKNDRNIYNYLDRKDNDFFIQAWSQKGGNLMSIGRNFEALECYNEAIKLNLYRKKVLEAIVHEKEVVRIKGLLVSDYINKGIVLFELGMYLEAIESYNQAIQLESYNQNIYFHKGNALEKANRHLEAIECYKTAINIDPHTCKVVLNNNLGISLHNLENYLEAIEYYNQAIQYNPDYADSYNNKGNTLMKIGRHAEAIESYNEAIKLAPDNIDYYLNKGDAFSDLGKNLEAMLCYNKAITIKSNDSRAYNSKGKSFMNIGRNVEAIKCFSEAINIKPDYAKAYNNKGEALYNLDRNLEAIECYNEAIKLKFDEPVFYRNRANAFKKVGRQIEALQDLNKADDLIKINKAK